MKIYSSLSIFIWFNHYFLIIFFVSIPADPNRVPYDLPEAESEPIAGFITEYSTIYITISLYTCLIYDMSVIDLLSLFIQLVIKNH